MPLLISSYSLDKVPEVNNAFKMFFVFFPDVSSHQEVFLYKWESVCEKWSACLLSLNWNQAWNGPQSRGLACPKCEAQVSQEKISAYQ